MSYVRYVFADDGRLLGVACGDTKEAVLKTRLPVGIEYIERGEPVRGIHQYRAKIENGKIILDKQGFPQLSVAPENDADKEIARAKEEFLLKQIQSMVSSKSQTYIKKKLLKLRQSKQSPRS